MTGLQFHRWRDVDETQYQVHQTLFAVIELALRFLVEQFGHRLAQSPPPTKYGRMIPLEQGGERGTTDREKCVMGDPKINKLKRTEKYFGGYHSPDN